MQYFPRFFVVALFLACTVMAVPAAAQPVDSTITNVTVFTNQALVTRSASVDVTEGTNRLVVSTDAADIVSDSVTAAVFGEGEVLGVQITRTPLPERPREILRELESRLDELKTEKQALLDARETLSRQESFLNGIIDFSGSQIPGEMKTQMPSTEYLDSYLSFFDETFNSLFDQRRAIDGSLSSLDREIEHLRRQIAQYRDADEKTRTGIEILFSSAGNQSVTVEARYRVARAQWSPLYRASVEDDMKGVNLAMMAEITQTTGEDWNDVELTVSNAVPIRVGRLPHLDPWWLHYSEAAPARLDSAMKRTAMEQRAPTLMAEAPPAEALRRERTLSFEYTMPMAVTILSRQQETQAPILSRTLVGDFYHYAVPVLTNDAYLVCEARADQELLPGPVNIFFENSYTGRMMLDEQGPGDSFTLPLGIDRSVRVAREKLMDTMEETSFFGRVERKTIQRELSYRIKAENLKEHPVTVQLTDHVPVSRTDRIMVEDVSFSKAPDRHDVDERAGVVQWNLELAPGESTEIIINFTVAYPREMERPVF